MLLIKEIRKKYVTGDLTQIALNNVSFNLRDNEFVAILGQSGSGKTTLLNIIGGLDRYDSGDIVINGISTKKYRDRDWDSYRNHTIGFVFQSYNLIPHQSILSNVELALTISGISKSERRKRAKQALEQVGLGEQLHKRPNQMSGGQMQRVAIARALVNDPDILLADEPTGALDSETSVQVMNLLQEVAKNRLVVMVTHNAELADEYANRIIKLHDGNIVDDTNPFTVDDSILHQSEHKTMGKASMSFLTSLALSFNNLRTKKARTLLTAFAGSIGIIGIASILALSNGVNSYIQSIQKDTMASYPITIEAQSFDLSSMISAGREANHRELTHELDGAYSNSIGLKMANSAITSIKKNNLTTFKKYLDTPNNAINQYIGENGIVYSYPVKFDVYSYDIDGELVNADGSGFEKSRTTNRATRQGMPGMSFGNASSSHFEELLPGVNGNLISSAILDNYEMIHGKWPASANEVILVMDQNNELPLSALYELGFLPSSEYQKILDQLDKGEEITFSSHKFSYDDLLAHQLYLVPMSDYYVKEKNGLFSSFKENDELLIEHLKKSTQLHIVGIIKPKEDAGYQAITSVVGYTFALTNELIDKTNTSAVVKAQEVSPDTNVLNGMTFEPSDDAVKIEDTKTYLSNLGVSEKAKLFKDIIRMAYADQPAIAQRMLGMSEIELASMLDNYLNNPEDETLLMMYDAYISVGNYDENMSAFGMVSKDAPSSISIYADSFEDKDAISEAIKEYNKTKGPEDQITYTDYVGLLMSSVTTIVNVISYVLIAFVAVSLIVSSIMIGIITYISVLERTKEIGILRAIGASKSNISQVFNAETFIIGLISGLLGVGITALMLIPGNMIIHRITNVSSVNASLPWSSAIVLVILSMVLTLIAGLIPSRKAAKKDPVIALRSE